MLELPAELRLIRYCDRLTMTKDILLYTDWQMKLHGGKRMVCLTFYGGINEIGGNKILLEDEDQRLFLGFGFPYKRHKLFYEEYLKPRSGAGLLDPLAMGLLPPLEGIYRDDIETAGLWQRFRHTPLYRRIDQVDGVLLSHAHLDHSGQISFMRKDIAVYATSVTAFIAKAMQGHILGQGRLTVTHQR